ncbi:hypothetical protein [Allosalinactinospora lopnorensis]|uniref:hypothetical protein n=1 Tax=Allosalinactinospora lopnorensis TaxID=1352348 RepID=UPI000623EA9B|nr:hypothetical protein [Allosalinactinospora lopnorensis]
MKFKKRLAWILSSVALAGATVITVGAPAPVSAQEEASTLSSDKWGVIGRNTLGSPNATLRDGPYGRTSVEDIAARQSPPYGRGSLGIIVGSGTEKINFGNETDFAGLRLSNINILRYWIFTGMDSMSGVSLPGATLEVNPGLDPNVTYSTLVYLPDRSNSPSAPDTRAPNVWQHYDAGADGSAWYATGATGSAIGCTLSSPCSFADLKTRLPDAEITYSLGITKGRDNPFVGAVDGLRVNNRAYDFERVGVITRLPRY